jgi:ubiquinone/menaquinone biosynthesis C-methylase UbiE
MNRNKVEQIQDKIIAEPVFGDTVGFVLGKFGDLQNKVVLDSGCGLGTMSVFFALQGAKVIGIDINRDSISKSISLAHQFGVEGSCLFLQECSESIGVASDSIDILFSKSTLQYMERDKALNEYMRILKPDGTIVLLENLPYNPLINIFRIYRRLFSKTKQEVDYVKSIRGYITLHNVELFANRFHYSEHREYHLLRVLSIYLRLHSRQNSFWQTKLDLVLSNLDKKILTLFPFLSNVAWVMGLYCNSKKCSREMSLLSDMQSLEGGLTSPPKTTTI